MTVKQRSRAPNLNDQTIERIVEILDGWSTPKLTWELLIEQILLRHRTAYTRQAFIIMCESRMVVPGWIEKRDRGADGRRDLSSGFWVYVFGSADEVRALLEAHELLDAPWMRLKPVDAAGRADIDRWLADAAKGFEKADPSPPAVPEK